MGLIAALHILRVVYPAHKKELMLTACQSEALYMCEDFVLVTETCWDPCVMLHVWLMCMHLLPSPPGELRVSFYPKKYIVNVQNLEFTENC